MGVDEHMERMEIGGVLIAVAGALFMVVEALGIVDVLMFCVGVVFAAVACWVVGSMAERLLNKIL